MEKYGRARQATDHNITWRMSRKFKIRDINRQIRERMNKDSLLRLIMKYHPFEKRHQERPRKRIIDSLWEWNRSKGQNLWMICDEDDDVWYRKSRKLQVAIVIFNMPLP